MSNKNILLTPREVQFYLMLCQFLLTKAEDLRKKYNNINYSKVNIIYTIDDTTDLIQYHELKRISKFFTKSRYFSFTGRKSGKMYISIYGGNKISYLKKIILKYTSFFKIK